MDLIINASAAVYNPAVARLARWREQQGYATQEYPGRRGPTPLEMYLAARVYISVLFSWDLPAVVRLVRLAQHYGKPVEIGGPAATANAAWLTAQTGVAPWQGPHPAATVLLEQPRQTWTSRGCVNRCAFCQVWRVEGPLTELPENAWQPAPVILDNNFLACTEAHQERVVQRLAAAGLPPVDFNQGLDARLYTPAFRHLVERAGLRLRYWRFAYDAPEQWPYLDRALNDLAGAGVNWNRIRVYLLYNCQESPAEAQARAEQLIGHREHPRAVPWPMAYRPLDWLQRGYYVSPAWTLPEIRDFRRYYSRPRLWRSVSWAEYDRAYPRSVPAAYPRDWPQIAHAVKTAAGWQCVHCGHPHAPEAGYCLTVHHLDGNPGNNAPENLAALCQRCHLRIQSAYYPGQTFLPGFPTPAWAQPFLPALAGVG